MTEGISKGRFLELTSNLYGLSVYDLRRKLIEACEELDPWLPIDEYLKNPKHGWCYISLDIGQVHMSYHAADGIDDKFYCDDSCSEYYYMKNIIAVKHIATPTHYKLLPEYIK